MTSNSLNDIFSDINMEVEVDFKVIDTICEVSKVLTVKDNEKFQTKLFYLYNTLESFFIEVTWEDNMFLAEIMCLKHQKEQCDLKPYFGDSTIFDQTDQCEYNMVPIKDSPTYTSCDLSNNPEFNDTRLLVFTFCVKYVRPSYENICPTQSELYERLENVFQDKKYTDAKINVKGKEFLIHKAIISRCPILNELIRNNNIKKNKNNAIDINDIEPEIFEVILKYLYLGVADSIDLYESNNEFLFNVILAADYYQIIDLKNKLIDIAIKYLSITNVISNLIFAEKHNIFHLKENCMKFMRVYGKSIIKTAPFVELVQVHPKLSADVILYILREFDRLF